MKSIEAQRETRSVPWDQEIWFDMACKELYESVSRCQQISASSQDLVVYSIYFRSLQNISSTSSFVSPAINTCLIHRIEESRTKDAYVHRRDD